MQINDVSEEQRSDKQENVTLPECPQIGHQITTQQGGEEVGWCDSLADKEKEKKGIIYGTEWQPILSPVMVKKRLYCTRGIHSASQYG